MPFTALFLAGGLGSLNGLVCLFGFPFAVVLLILPQLGKSSGKAILLSPAERFVPPTPFFSIVGIPPPIEDERNRGIGNGGISALANEQETLVQRLPSRRTRTDVVASWHATPRIAPPCG